MSFVVEIKTARGWRVVQECASEHKARIAAQQLIKSGTNARYGCK